MAAADDGPTVRTSPEASDADVEVRPMLWAIIAILLVLWLLGLIGSIGGGFIHLLLVIAIIVLIAQFLMGRRTSV